jgi:hypothetical protein
VASYENALSDAVFMANVINKPYVVLKSTKYSKWICTLKEEADKAKRIYSEEDVIYPNGISHNKYT